MRSRRIENFSYWLVQDRIPLVKALIICNAATFFIITLGNLQFVERLFVFDPAWIIASPWTVATYPLVGSRDDLISLIFASIWLWFAGGGLERSWGTGKFGAFFFGMSAASALGLLAGYALTGVSAPVSGLWLPLAGVTVAFGMLNPEEQALLWFVIPIKLKYLALIAVGVVLVSYGRANITLGALALTGCAFSYWWVRGRRSFLLGRHVSTRGKAIRIHRGKSALRWLNPLNWYREYRDRKRLRDLFHN
ncbi:MAG: rhomboid family intramembrane serine protease [Armatimonadetes bacterium]|nr:rhomboid family intramembrane serine protease [Armatimonadota bacterium]